MTREGHYYSWDVRLASNCCGKYESCLNGECYMLCMLYNAASFRLISLLVAWVFLIAYYKK